MLSQKPYFIRAIYEWCNDNNFTPFIATTIDENTKVPNQYAKQSQIVLNIAHDATHDLLIDNDWITFKATFSGIIYDLAIPVHNVLAIFAQENGQGMQFAEPSEDNNHNPETKTKKNSGLRLIK